MGDDTDTSGARMLVIAGPTAGGKSDLGVAVCQALTHRGAFGEVVSADSMQVYRGLDIGSAKPTEEERRGVVHHLIDVADPSGEQFTVYDWLRQAEAAIGDIRSRGGVPVVVGGTNLYLKALLEGLFEGPEPDPELRARIASMDQRERRARLASVDPESAARIHPADERRTVRALEVHAQTGRPISELQQQWDRQRSVRTDAVLLGLDWPAELINPRINQRVKQMMERGLLEETRGLLDRGELGAQAREALGYKQLLAHLEGGEPLEKCVERIKIETRRFAKNQRTWLRRLRATPGSVWIDASAEPMERWADIGLAALGGV